MGLNWQSSRIGNYRMSSFIRLAAVVDSLVCGRSFGELTSLGGSLRNSVPRMAACQSSGCFPIVDAFRSGVRHAEISVDPAPAAVGIP
ncbi:MAG: hypothetical protein M2R45_03969 [Verrucomicrobia subdivision 3 bacterium]|nr:hypothetical protein [Limisphaerales bacterium]MCS1415511.1 hypothetical protein [Limisphaerales bacterium]